MDDVQDDTKVEGRHRPRWQLAVLALTLVALPVALVGAVVAVRAGGSAAHQSVNVAAVPIDPNAGNVAAVSLQMNGTTTFVKTVQGLTITSKGPGTGLQFGRGLTNDTTFSDWIKQLHDSGKTAAKRDITMQLLDNTFQVLKTFHVAGALPVSLTVGPIDGGAAAPALETLTVSYDGITVG